MQKTSTGRYRENYKGRTFEVERRRDGEDGPFMWFATVNPRETDFPRVTGELEPQRTKRAAVELAVRAIAAGLAQPVMPVAEETGVTVIRMTGRDFDRLWTEATGRPGTLWPYAYWTDSWTSVVLMRSFLESGGHRHEVVDNLVFASSATPFIVFTTYASPGMAKNRSAG